MTEPEQIQAWLEVLASSDDREEIEAAAIGVVESGDAEALEKLGKLLGYRSFLARLDDIESPPDKTYHLHQVLAAMARHPSAETGELCVRLAADPDFLADDDRRIDLLPAITAVRPMSEEAAAVVAQAAAEGYFSTVVPLLVENESPRALALFEALIRDTGVEPERRIASLHAAVLPRRADAPVLGAAARLLASGLEEPVANGLLETLFDYRSREWFGPARTPPLPPPWETGSTEALELVLSIGEAARARGVPPEIAAAIDRTLAAVRRILEGRRDVTGSP